jgi:hypothetical protein
VQARALGVPLTVMALSLALVAVWSAVSGKSAFAV